MSRIATVPVLLFALAAGAHAGPREAKVILENAIRLMENPPPGMSQEQALDEGFQMMAEAARLDPSNWGIPMHMGLNRCMKAYLNREMLTQRLELMRSAGVHPDEVARIDARGKDFIDQVVMVAYRAFQEMTQTMRKTRTRDKDAIDYANAMMKFANSEYLEAKRGEPGAIDDLKALLKRGWRPQQCADLIAQMYLRLGADSFREEDFTQAQKYWDSGLNFAQTDRLRRDLLTNKASAHATRNEYTKAEEVLRDLLRREPAQPDHWKNLGLVLGYQNLLDPALYAYRQARRLSRELGRDDEVAWHQGNAWLKAAMIHGKLKEADGDLLTAWRLFLEYRRMFGDDYNFCFNFGEFCFHMEQHDLAWVFLRRAADINPFCPTPYLLLVRVAQRMTSGTKEEQEARREKAKADLDEARSRFSPNLESHAVKRICGGLREWGEERRANGPVPPIEPDPLEGASAENPPDWLGAKAAEREPHELFDPPVEEFLGIETPKKSVATAAGETGEGAAGRIPWFAGAAGALAGAVAVLLWRRRRRAA